MPDPTDYWSHLIPANPVGEFLAGQQQRRVAQSQQLTIDAQNLALQQARQQQVAVQAQAARQAAALNTMLANPNPKNIASYQMVAPEHAAQIKNAFDTLHADAQDGELKYAANLNGLLTAGDTDGAKAAVQRRIDADKAAGVDTADDEHALELLANGGTKGAQTVLGLTRLGLASVGGPEHVVPNMTSQATQAREDAKAAALLPGAAAAQDADTALKQAQAAREQYITANSGDTVLKIGAPQQATPPAQAPAPASQGAPSRPIPGPVGQTITQAAQAAGASPEELSYLHATAKLESSGNPGAKNGSSTGVFQFHPDTFASVGGGNIASVADQTVAAINLAKHNSDVLTPVLGGHPTGAQLYLAHQQGEAGAAALLTAPPEINAISALEGAGVPKARARASILGNGGSANMTAGQFVQKWTEKYNQAAGVPTPGMPTVREANEAAQAASGSGLTVAFQGPKPVDESALSPEAVAMVGQQYLSLGPVALQNMGQGRTGVSNKAKVMEWAANAAREAGTSNPELVMRFVQNKANVAALGQMQKNLSGLTASENTLISNLNLAKQYASKGVGPTGSPFLNMPLQAIRRQGLGSVDAKTYDNILRTVATEYAKILTTSTGAGNVALSDSARHEVETMLNSNMTLGQFFGAADAAKLEAENRRLSTQGEIDRLRGEIGGRPTTAPTVPAPPAATVLRFDAHGNPIQ